MSRESQSTKVKTDAVAVGRSPPANESNKTDGEDANANAGQSTITRTKSAKVKRRETKQLHRLHRYLFQQRVLKATTACTILSAVLWIVSISTDNWLVYQFNELHVDAMQNRILQYTSGLWRSCVQTEKSTDCKMHLFLSGDSRSYDFFFGNMTSADYENTLSFRRSEIAFAMVTLILMAIGNTFAIYAIRHVRYTYKRLTAGVHVLTAICSLVCLEIVINLPKTVTTNTYSPPTKQMTTAKPRGHAHTPIFGYSVILAWMVFIMYLSGGVLFLLFSKKLKGTRAPTAEVKDANEPLQLSRP